VKKLLLLLLLVGWLGNSHAARVSFAFTNSVGAPDTNWFVVTPVENYVSANGGFITRGLPVRLTPGSNGKVTNTFAVGNYAVTNRYVSSGFLIRVPEDSSATVYNATEGTDSGGIALSGYNRFVTIERGTNNIVLAPGDNITVTTNGVNNFTISSTGGGEGIAVAAGENVTLTTNGSVVTIAAEAGGTSNAITNQDSRALWFPGGVTSSAFVSSGAISAVSGISVSAGQFNGNAGGLTNFTDIPTNAWDATAYEWVSGLTGGGISEGSASNLSFRISATNSTSGNAATATMATNVNIASSAQYEIPTVLTSIGDSVRFTTSPNFTFNSTADALILGTDSWRTRISMWDTRHDDPTFFFTHDGLGSTRGLTLTNGGSFKWYHNANVLPLFAPELHSGYEYVNYAGGWDWDAWAWQIEGLSTNGPRFSWLLNEQGQSVNLYSPTNGSQFIGLKVGLSANAQRDWLGYNGTNNAVTLNDNSRSLSIVGSNIVATVNTNSLTIASNRVTINGDVYQNANTYLGSATANTGGLYFWDSLNEVYRSFTYDIDTESFLVSLGLNTGGNLIVDWVGTIYGNGAGISNVTATVTLTNNSGYAGLVVGSGIGTNIYASLTNTFTGTGAIVLSNAPTLRDPTILGSLNVAEMNVTNLYSTATGNTNALAVFASGNLTNAPIVTTAFTNGVAGRMLIPGTSYYITVYTNVP